MNRVLELLSNALTSIRLTRQQETRTESIAFVLPDDFEYRPPRRPATGMPVTRFQLDNVGVIQDYWCFRQEAPEIKGAIVIPVLADATSKEFVFGIALPPNLIDFRPVIMAFLL